MWDEGRLRFLLVQSRLAQFPNESWHACKTCHCKTLRLLCSDPVAFCGGRSDVGRGAQRDKSDLEHERNPPVERPNKRLSRRSSGSQNRLCVPLIRTFSPANHWNRTRDINL